MRQISFTDSFGAGKYFFVPIICRSRRRNEYNSSFSVTFDCNVNKELVIFNTASFFIFAFLTRQSIPKVELVLIAKISVICGFKSHSNSAICSSFFERLHSRDHTELASYLDRKSLKTPHTSATERTYSFQILLSVRNFVTSDGSSESFIMIEIKSDIFFVITESRNTFSSWIISLLLRYFVCWRNLSVSAEESLGSAASSIEDWVSTMFFLVANVKVDCFLTICRFGAEAMYSTILSVLFLISDHNTLAFLTMSFF